MGQVEDALQLHKLAQKSRHMYREAFIDHTGLMPNQVVMLYGEEVVEERGRMMKRFFVRFIPHDVSEEIRTLQDQIKGLQVKNSAMQLVLAALATKAEVSDEKLVTLLQESEAEILGMIFGHEPQPPACEQAHENEAPGFARDPAI